jgi:GDP-4-dehydro-6-deoxy-D-mannose reductase
MAEDAPAAVFHLAALTRLSDCEDRPALAHSVNVQGSANVFGAMPEGARGLLASTCHVYGRPQVACVDEEQPTDPRGVYAQSKFDAEREALASGRDVVIARAFHHTGPGQAPTFVLANWAAQMRAGQSQIAVGDLDIRRDFCDVRDTVEGYRLLLNRGEAGTVYNLASGHAERLGTFFDWMCGGRPCAPAVQAERLRTNDIPVFCGDPARAEAVGWRRRYAIKDTLAEMAR